MKGSPPLQRQLAGVFQPDVLSGHTQNWAYKSSPQWTHLMRKEVLFLRMRSWSENTAARGKRPVLFKKPEVSGHKLV